MNRVEVLLTVAAQREWNAKSRTCQTGSACYRFALRSKSEGFEYSLQFVAVFESWVVRRSLDSCSDYVPIQGRLKLLSREARQSVCPGPQSVWAGR